MNLFCLNYFPGNIPNISEGIVERKVCFLGNQAGNFCVHHLQIQVKNCGDYRVYYLYPTPSNDEAYCFGNCTRVENNDFHKSIKKSFFFLRRIETKLTKNRLFISGMDKIGKFHTLILLQVWQSVYPIFKFIYRCIKNYHQKSSSKH